MGVWIPAMSDEGFDDLLRAARGGDPDARERLVERHLPALRAYVRLQTGEDLRAKESCSDLVQSVCRELLQDLGGFRSENEPAFRKWLYALALRKIVDRRRYYTAQKRDLGREAGTSPTDDSGLLEVYGTVFTPSRHAAAREEVARLEAAFDQLPTEYREVLTQARILGLSHKEIGERVGKSPEAVRMLLHRARARLARLLD